MKSHWIKLILVALVAIIGIALALPEFSFTVANREITYPSIGFSRIGVPVDYASFEKGAGFVSSTEFKGEVVFDEGIAEEDQLDEARDLVNQYNRRIRQVGLEDIRAYLVEENDVIKIVIEVSNKYDNQENYVNWITARGDLSFRSPQLPSLAVDPTDVEGRLRLESISTGSDTFQTVRFVFNDSVETELISVDNQMQLYLDNAPILSLITEETKVTLSSGTQPSVDQTFNNLLRFGITTNGALSFEEQTDLANFIRVYFSEEAPLVNEVEIEEETVLRSQTDLREGVTLLASMFGVFILLLVLNKVRTAGIKDTLEVASYAFFSLLFGVVFMKLFGIELTVETSIGLVVCILFIFDFASEYASLKLEKDRFREELTRMAGRYLLLGIALLPILFINFAFVEFIEGFVKALLASFFVMIVMLFTVNIYIKELFNLRK